MSTIPSCKTNATPMHVPNMWRESNQYSRHPLHATWTRMAYYGSTLACDDCSTFAYEDRKVLTYDERRCSAFNNCWALAYDNRKVLAGNN